MREQHDGSCTESGPQVRQQELTASLFVELRRRNYAGVDALLIEYQETGSSLMRGVDVPPPRGKQVAV